MKVLEKLSPLEKEMLFKAPAYVSQLAANAEINEDEKKTAIIFEPIKTYSCDSLPIDFYGEVEKQFNTNIEQFDNKLPKGKAK